MKTIIRILMLGLLFFPMSAFAQKATDQKEYEIRVEWEDLQGYSERISYKIPIYYDDDDNVVKHGALKINYKEDLSSYVGQKCIITYVVSGNYVNGNLDGILSVEKGVVAQQVTLKTKGILHFDNGDPTGTWTFSEIATMGGKSESTKCSVTIDGGSLLVCYDDGEESYKFDPVNNTFSGTLNGDVYKNNTNTSRFIRKTGEMTKLDENAAGLINAFIAGTTTESDLLAKGFVFEKDRWINDYDLDNLDYYISKLDVNPFMDYAVSVSPYTLIGFTKRYLEDSFAYTLMRISLLSAEELIDIASTIKSAKSVSENENQVSWDFYSGESVSWGYSNSINVSGETYYFTDEVALQFEKAVKDAIEERRLEERTKILESVVTYFNSEIVNNSDSSIISYEAEGIEETSKGNYTIPSIINVRSGELEGAYKTYKINVYVSEGYYSLEIDEERTFAQSNLVHIRNDYDVIIDLDRQIAANEKKIEGMSKSVFNSYKAYVASLDMAVKHNDLKATIAARNSLLATQNDVFAFAKKQNELQKGDTEISSKYASEMEFLTAYSTYMKSRDLSWSPTGAIARIDGFLAVQKRVHEFIGKVAEIREKDAEVSSKSVELKDVLKAYTAYAKTRDLSWTSEWSLEKVDGYIAVQKTCLEFIELRTVAMANDAKIKALKSSAPTMNKSYTVYASACDLSWTPEGDFVKINSLIDLQNRYLAALAKDNIKEIDKLIKKEKMTDILKILEMEELK